MEETSTENAKISDSGYSNTCSNSQSHASSGSSVSRNSNRSASSGYHGGNPSLFESSTETLPKPITKRKDKGYKKKKSKGASTTIAHLDGSQTLTGAAIIPAPIVNVHSVPIVEPCKQTLLVKKTEEVAVVELVDVTDPGIHNDINVLSSGPDAGLASKTNPIDEGSLQSTEDYYAVISMHDGIVLHATPTLLASLGYPKDSWTGKLFLDFLDHKDRKALTERIAREIATSRDFCSQGVNGRKAAEIFCRLRRCNIPQHISQSSPSQPMNVDQSVPYRVSMIVQNFHGDKVSVSPNQITLMVASFQLVESAYKVPEETIISTVFTTRHTATCRLSYVDPEVVQYLGYLPQDMIERSLFDYYYPEDLPLIKDIYETVINLDSSTFRSKPYRFIVQNGCFVVMETEWSSFVNPWTKSLEFVVGQHRVIKGPADPDVFKTPIVDLAKGILANVSGEVLKEARLIQEEIRTLLVEGVRRKTFCPGSVDSDLLSKKKELTLFVESILQEIKSPAPIKDHMAVDDRSFSEHDSVMLGEISPHHEYYDSKSSTETPPSYNQLNYHDNIERFFNSNIGVSVNNRPYGSDEENLHSSANSSDDPKLKCTSSTNGSGNSGSAENLSSESNNQQSFGGGSGAETSNATSNNSTGNERRLKLPILTESVLNRHNEDMEKLMVQKHRELKKGDKRNKSSLNDQKLKMPDQSAGRADAINKNAARLKRSGSQSWEGENHFKISKYDESAKPTQNVNQMTSMANQKYGATGMDPSNLTKANANLNFWSPASVTMPSTTTIAHQCFTTPNACSQAMTRALPAFPQMFPVYYLPVPRETPPPNVIPQEHPGSSNHLTQPAPYCFVPVSYMTTAVPPLMFPPLIGATAAAPMMCRSYLVPDASAATATPMSTAVTQAQPTTTTTAASFDSKRPASRATSVKAEPGSTVAMSESSKKVCSPSGVVSSCVSNEGGCFFSGCPNKSCESVNHAEQQRHVASSFETSKSQQQTAQGNSVETSPSRRAFGIVRREPPWIEGVKLTPELIFQYQVGPRPLGEILKSDLDFLRQSKQPNLVNDQLGQLFLDLDLEGFGSKLILEQAGTNSASDSSSDTSHSPSRMGAW